MRAISTYSNVQYSAVRCSALQCVEYFAPWRCIPFNSAKLCSIHDLVVCSLSMQTFNFAFLWVSVVHAFKSEFLWIIACFRRFLFFFYFRIFKMHMHKTHKPAHFAIKCVYVCLIAGSGILFVNSPVTKITTPHQNKKNVIYIYIVNYTLIGCHVVHYIIRNAYAKHWLCTTRIKHTFV